MMRRKIDGMRYERQKFSKTHIHKLSRGFRIGLYIDNVFKRIHQLARRILGYNRWRL